MTSPVSTLTPVHVVRALRRRWKKFFSKNFLLTEQDFENGRPLTSENTWKALTNHYVSMDRPARILEYGSGFSTYYHIKSLLYHRGGHLVSVEHNTEWYRGMARSLERVYGKFFDNERIEISESGRVVVLDYLLRPGTASEGCGTLKEFNKYVLAPTGKFDLVVVDGRARKACVNHVLDQDLLNGDGLLVLFEAGRGHPEWRNEKQMAGTFDYQPEVNRLLEMGGEIVDGNGLERWSNWVSNRKPHKFVSESSPKEACFYRAPCDTR